jgi:hypothetical protein
LLKVALKHQNSKINQPLWSRIYYWIWCLWFGLCFY